MFGTTIATLFGSEHDAVRQIHRVLVISSFNEGNAWNDPIVRGIQAVFRSAPQKIDADFEYLDFTRHPEPSHEALFISYLHSKVRESRPDLILTADDPALRLVFKYRGGFLPEVPVVFCGVDDFRNSAAYVTEHRKERPWLAGVLEHFEIDATIELALALHSGTREIVTIGDSWDFAAALAQSHRDLRVRTIDAYRLPLDRIKSELSGLKPGSILLFMPFYSDGDGVAYQTADSAAIVRDNVHVPVYTISYPSLGLGPVGGKIADPYLQGQTAASMAVSILGGLAPTAIGIEGGSGNLYEFDERELRRWHIRESSLPKGSILINRPRTFTEVHPLLTASLCLFASVQTLIIAFLLVQRNRRHLAEAALRRHSQQLAHSNYMLEQFAYITAHDFQEPIRSVALFAEFLKRSSLEKLDQEQRQALEFVLSNSLRIHAMVRGLLAWVRSVEAPPDSVLWCDLNRIWPEVVDRHREVIDKEGVLILSGQLPSVATHAHHMRELLNHLLDNALQHGGSSGLTVQIRSQREDNSWKISVHNSGQPIPDSLHSKVFGVFRRLDNKAGERHGIGMGLAICRRIVDFYGGRIWIYTPMHGGCTFCFTIPDKPRPRARRPSRGFFQIVSFASTHAHSDH